MTASEKVKALVDSGEALDANEAAEMLLDMGEISEATFEKLVLATARAKVRANAVGFGDKYGASTKFVEFLLGEGKG